VSTSEEDEYNLALENLLTGLGTKNFNQVLFAIELTGVSWDFGALVFNNVVIVSFTHFYYNT
jgi:hypothetical protein